MIDFYTNPQSRGAIARWMLEEVGVPYRQHILDYQGGMKTPEYLAINPMGKVPAIVDDGVVVTEAPAICVYLAQTRPEAGLAPRPEELAAYFRWMFFAAGPVESAVSNRAAKFEPAPEMQATLGYGNYDLVVATLEQAVGSSPYIAGDRFTAADVYVGSHVIWGLMFGTLPDRPAFAAYRDRLVERPAYQKASAIDQELAAG